MKRFQGLKSTTKWLGLDLGREDVGDFLGHVGAVENGFAHDQNALLGMKRTCSNLVIF